MQDPGWRAALAPEFEKPYYKALQQFLAGEPHTLPPRELVFNAFEQTPLAAVRVVILGQDPYPTPGVAMGLAFSVQDGVKVPASLRNIYKELNADLGIPVAQTGNLEPWARQGVLLLNATLTVRAGEPNSHQGKGWEHFTNAAIATVNAEREGVVFLLWGKFAQGKAGLIDAKRHHLLTAGHPSPLAARKGFFGCRHFSKTNALLATPIDWRVE